MIIFLGIKLHDILFSPYYSSASNENKKYRGSDFASFSDDSGLSVCPYDFSTSRCIAWLFNGV